MSEKQEKDKGRKLVFFEYVLRGDWVVLAGRTDADND